MQSKNFLFTFAFVAHFLLQLLVYCLNVCECTAYLHRRSVALMGFILFTVSFCCQQRQADRLSLTAWCYFEDRLFVRTKRVELNMSNHLRPSEWKNKKTTASIYPLTFSAWFCLHPDFTCFSQFYIFQKYAYLAYQLIFRAMKLIAYACVGTVKSLREHD